LLPNIFRGNQSAGQPTNDPATPDLELASPSSQVSLPLPKIKQQADRLIFNQVVAARAFVAWTYGGLDEFHAYIEDLPHKDGEFARICWRFSELCSMSILLFVLT